MLKEILIYLSCYIGLVAFIFYTLGFRERIRRKEPVFSERNAPFVSILIPAFNEEKGIAATIKSALAADYPRDKLEILVIDDGSKDRTYEIAKKFESSRVHVLTKENGGKATALNMAIKKAKGEIIFTMDADSSIRKDSIKNQVAKFIDPRVMCVSPIVAVYKPKGIWQRVQQVEYLLGIFIREAFASYNAIHITPGAFSAYRKTFFDKYGGYSENNLTEDLEMSLRIQYNHFIVENSNNAVVYTNAPTKFKALMVQRRRWYGGLIKNLMHYSKLLGKEYGALGTVVLPVAISAIFFSVALTLHAVIKLITNTYKEINYLSSINFDYSHTVNFTWNSLGRYVFEFVSSPVVMFLAIFFLMSIGYLMYAKTKVREHSNVMISLPLFFIFYALLFAFWWSVAFIYSIFNKQVSWR